MPVVADYLIAGGVSVLTGLDRTAAMQFMISRPIVAAPVTGYLLGNPWVGLQIGILVELLWLGRLPIGAALPPDDTQIAVGGTALAIVMGQKLGLSGFPMILLCLFVTIPLGKVGQTFDRLVRNGNGFLLRRAEAAARDNQLSAIDRWHLAGVFLFAGASLATYLVIVVVGSVLVPLLTPYLMAPISASTPWIKLTFPLVGTALFLGSINIDRSAALFHASFIVAFLLLWRL